MKKESPAIGIIGGSGLYQMEEVHDATEHKIDTPFGPPLRQHRLGDGISQGGAVR
jgi:purine nucleoside phosphorylase